MVDLGQADPDRCEGELVGWRGVASDITDARLYGNDSVRAARTDPLTGLANRLLVRELLEEAVLRQWESDSGCALLLVDLDRFKLVNDTLGHAIGDQLLVEVGRRLETRRSARAVVSAASAATNSPSSGAATAIESDSSRCRRPDHRRPVEELHHRRGDPARRRDDRHRRSARPTATAKSS